MRNAARLIALGMALGLGLFTSGESRAEFFTLDAQITLLGTETGNPGIIGTIDPVDDTTGTFTTNVGTSPLTGHDVFVIDITLGAGSADVDNIAISVGTSGFGFDLTDAGYFDAPGDDPDGVLADFINFVGEFDYSADHLVDGETTVRLFVVYDPEGTMAIGQTATIRLSSGTNFMVQGTIIPEPSTFLLLTVGLAGLSVVSRRRAR